MPVTINIEKEITLADLLQRKEEGYSIMETPHIGNLAMSTLALLTLGFRANLVDVNIGEKDNLFYPHQIIKNGRTETIAPANLMTTHNKVSLTGQKLCEFHTAPLRKLGLNAICHSEWISDRREEVFEVLKAIYRYPWGSLWRRYVDCHGLTSQRLPESSNLLDQVHKVSAPADGIGWVLPNPVNILLDIIFGVKETDKNTVYMLSGQSMYKYITKGYDSFGTMSHLISQLYEDVRRFDFTLPDRVEVQMVPTPILRHFVAPYSHKDKLDAKLKYYSKVKAGNTRVGTKFQRGEVSKETKARLTHKRRQKFQSLSYPLSLFCADSETGMYYTQHDLVEKSRRVYIPEEVLNMTISKMMTIADTMRKFSHVKKGV